MTCVVCFCLRPLLPGSPLSRWWCSLTGDNSVDLFTNDIGVVVMTNPSTKELLGYNIVVGGGMGRSHRNEETFPRLADPRGYVSRDNIFHAIKV